MVLRFAEQNSTSSKRHGALHISTAVLNAVNPIAKQTARLKMKVNKKYKADGDPIAAPVEFRNTPSVIVAASSIRCLFRRRTRTTVPTYAGLLDPDVVSPSVVKSELKKRTWMQKSL